MSPEQKETFLIIVQDRSNGWVQAFVKECTYNELSQLNHDAWNLHVYLLAAEPDPTWAQYGTQLTHVIDFAAVYQAQALAKQAAWHLSRLPVPQRALELQKIISDLQGELPQVKTLTQEEVQAITRFGGTLHEPEP